MTVTSVTWAQSQQEPAQRASWPGPDEAKKSPCPCSMLSSGFMVTHAFYRDKERGSSCGRLQSSQDPVLLAHLPLWPLFNPEGFPFRQDDPIYIGTRPLTLLWLG